MRYAVERLRDATRNRRATGRNMVDDGRAGSSNQDKLDPDAMLDAFLESEFLRRAIENQAIQVLHQAYMDTFDDADVARVIEAAEAPWLYGVMLTRALETVEAGG